MRPNASSTTFAVPETLINGAVRKAKNRLVPMIIIMYLIAYIDRANLGFAALRMNADLNLTPDLFGFAAGVSSPCRSFDFCSALPRPGWLPA
jgi:sugar phosphate permease